MRRLLWYGALFVAVFAVTFGVAYIVRMKVGEWQWLDSQKTGTESPSHPTASSPVQQPKQQPQQPKPLNTAQKTEPQPKPQPPKVSCSTPSIRTRANSYRPTYKEFELVMSCSIDRYKIDKETASVIIDQVYDIIEKSLQAQETMIDHLGFSFEVLVYSTSGKTDFVYGAIVAVSEFSYRAGLERLPCSERGTFPLPYTVKSYNYALVEHYLVACYYELFWETAEERQKRQEEAERWWKEEFPKKYPIINFVISRWYGALACLVFYDICLILILLDLLI